MRIISQDGEYDIPYESSVLRIEANVIWAFPTQADEYIVAQYSTQEKAEKAMQKLHESYAPEPLFIRKDVSPGERAAAGEISWAQALNEMRTGMFVRPIPDSSIEQVYTGNVVFRFPQEDEI